MADDHLAKKHHCPRKKPKLGIKEEFGEKGKNWKKMKFLEELDKSGRMGEFKKIDKIWNLDFVSLNHPDTC